MYTIKHYRWQAKQYLDYQRSRKNMKEIAKNVHKEIMQRRHFPIVRERIKEYWI